MTAPVNLKRAHQGTLFLDEMGNLSLQMQAKLLSAIQNKSVVRVGSNKPIDVDIRLICATNCNLPQMVADGLFREDLLYKDQHHQYRGSSLKGAGRGYFDFSRFFF